MRQAISIRGAKENNLKNVSVDIPRDKLIVLTGLSGSGKSSLAFDTLYAEGQRRYMESLSTWAKRFVQQLKKPNVEAVLGLSPVISIEQKTINKNPRSTVATMTDIGDYLRLLYASIGTPRCLHCEKNVPVKSPYHIAEHIMTLPKGATVEICAPVFPVYGEDYAYLFAEIRTHGCRRLRVDGTLYDISEDIETDEAVPHDLEVLVDTFTVKPGIEKQLMAGIAAALKLGEGFLRIRSEKATPGFFEGFACPEHHLTMGELEPWYFSFNENSSACVTCSGLGTYLQVHTGLLVPDRSRSILGGAFVPEAFRYSKDSWGGRMMYSLSQQYNFSLDMPFAELSPEIQDLLFYGTKGEKIEMLAVPGGNGGEKQIGRLWRFEGIANDVERNYRHYRKKQTAHSHMEDYLRKVMVEKTCPECHGTRLKRQRMCVLLGGQNIYERGQATLEEMRDQLRDLPPGTRNTEAGEHIRKELIPTFRDAFRWGIPTHTAFDTDFLRTRRNALRSR
jgi:excinuclease ABC subunit A